MLCSAPSLLLRLVQICSVATTRHSCDSCFVVTGCCCQIAFESIVQLASQAGMAVPSRNVKVLFGMAQGQGYPRYMPVKGFGQHCLVVRILSIQLGSSRREILLSCHEQLIIQWPFMHTACRCVQGSKSKKPGHQLLGRNVRALTDGRMRTSVRW